MPAYFPHWTLRRTGTIAPAERLPAGQTIALGIQHVVAMFGATVLAPLLMGFDPNVAILFSGVGTLLFFVAVGGRVPSYLGSSFAFIAVVIAASGYGGSGPNANLGIALGGIIAAGVVYALIGAGVMAVGYAWIERLMPPPVTGAIVAVIGLNLAPIAVKGVAGSAFDTWIGLATIVASRATSSTQCSPTAWAGASPSTSAGCWPPRGSAGRDSRRRSSTRRRCC
jgi:xanthine/uracil permease